VWAFAYSHIGKIVGVLEEMFSVGLNGMTRKSDKKSRMIDSKYRKLWPRHDLGKRGKGLNGAEILLETRPIPI